MAAFALVFALFPLQRRIQQTFGAMETRQPELLIRSGPLLSKLSLGYGPLLADVYWTRAIQYFGTHLANEDSNLSLLAPLLNITVTLDPQLKIAYRFGGIFLSEDAPVGAERPDQAIALIKRGIEANRDDWELWYDLGCVHYWHTKDYKAAAQAFLHAGSLPGSPEWMKAFAAAVEEKGNSLDTSRLMWLEAYKEAKDPRLQRNALYHLNELQIQKDLKDLRDALEQYQERLGHPASTIQDLVNGHSLRLALKDPAGYAYRICADSSPCLDPSSPWASVTSPRR